MSAFTNLTADLWTWSPWLRLEHDIEDVIGRCSKLFWLALYTTHDAKRSPPGLFAGSITSMAEAARMPADACVRYLDRLLEHDLVEFDREYRVLRLTQLPGVGDAYGVNAKVLRSWWTSFNKIPACDIRDSHVTTLKWMIDEWRRQKGEPLTTEQGKVWSETFGRVAIPPPRKRGVRRLVDNDTGTQAQPSLFSTLSQAPPDSGSGLDSRVSNDDDAHSSRSDRNSKLTVPELLINPLDPDPEQDPDLVSSLGQSSARSGSRVEPRIAASGSGAHGGADRPHLVLVPPASEVQPLLAQLAEGGNIDPRFTALREGTETRLRATFADLTAAQVTPDELLAMGRWISSTCALGQIPGDPFSKLSAWAATPGLAMAVLNSVRDRARQYAAVQDQIAAMSGKT